MSDRSTESETTINTTDQPQSCHSPVNVRLLTMTDRHIDRHRHRYTDRQTDRHRDRHSAATALSTSDS